jgi:hypothetical protein
MFKTSSANRECEMKMFIGLIVFGLLASEAKAGFEDDPTLAEMLTVADTPIVQQMIRASGDTLQWVNAELASRKQKKLFCLPKKRVLSTEDYIDILKIAAKNPGYAKMTFQTYPQHIINALKTAYPC